MPTHTVTFAQATYVLVTFAHTSNILAVTNPIFIKLLGPNFFGAFIFMDQNIFRPKIFFWPNICLGPNIFVTQNFSDQTFFQTKIFQTQNLFWAKIFWPLFSVESCWICYIVFMKCQINVSKNFNNKKKI